MNKGTVTLVKQNRDIKNTRTNNEKCQRKEEGDTELNRLRKDVTERETERDYEREIEKGRERVRERD